VVVHAVVHVVDHEADHEAAHEEVHEVGHEADQVDQVDVDQGADEEGLVGRMLDLHEVLDHPVVLEGDPVVVLHVLVVDHLDLTTCSVNINFNFK